MEECKNSKNNAVHYHQESAVQGNLDWVEVDTFKDLEPQSLCATQITTTKDEDYVVVTQEPEDDS
jgi:hypothetical protein